MKKFLIIALLISLNAFSISYEKIGEWGFGKYQQIAMKGDIVYGISKEAGISVIDFSNKENPQKIDAFYRNYKFNNMLISGNTAFISTDGALLIADISNNVPQILSMLDLPGDCRRMHLLNNLLFVAGGEGGLFVVDVSDLNHPSLYSHYQNDDFSFIVDVDVNDKYIYLADSEVGIFVLESSDYKDFSLVGNTKDAAYRVKLISSSYLMAALGKAGIKIYDMTDLLNVSLVGGYSATVNIVDFEYEGNTVYCANKTSGLLLLDITDMENITKISEVSAYDTFTALAKSGNYVFVAANKEGVLCVDVEDINSPSIKGVYNDCTYSNGVVAFDDKLVTSNFYGGLNFLSIEDPSFPVRLNQSNDLTFPFGIAQNYDVFYAACGDNGVGIYKVAGDELTFEGFFNIGASVIDVKYSSGLLFVSTDSNGLKVFDVSDAESPVEKASFFEGESVLNVFVYNRFISVSKGFDGVSLGKIDNGEIIWLQDIFFNGFIISSLFNGSSLIVSDFYNGVIFCVLNENYSIINEEVRYSGKFVDNFFLFDGLIYAAFEDYGVFIFSLDDNFSEVGHIQTNSNVKDLFVNERFLIIAEGESGRILVYRIVDRNTNIYTVPIYGLNKVEVENNCGKNAEVDIVVYKDLKPVQFKRIKIKGKGKVYLDLAKGDVLRCMSDANSVNVYLLPGSVFNQSNALTLKNSVAKKMYGYINPNSFYQVISIENKSKQSGYFTISFFDAGGRLVIQKDVFVEAGDSRSFNFMLRGWYSFVVSGDYEFTATLYQKGIFSSELKYLEPVRLELY